MIYILVECFGLCSIHDVRLKQVEARPGGTPYDGQVYQASGLWKVRN